MKRLFTILFIFIVSAGFCQPVKPHTFSPADPVSSSKINANFDTIYSWGSVASAAIELHKADTAAHGATGGVVGATKTQTLTNKSISGEQINSGTVADARIASTLARDSEVSTAVSTHAALTGTHGVTGVVGLSETQTLTNKTIGTGSTWNGNAISDAYINTAYSSAAMSTHRNSITSADTRSANYEPDDRDRGLYADFKGNSTDALSDGGSYHGVLTFRPYGNTTDMSGGYPFQLGFTENTNAWLRKATSATVWSGWYKLFHSGHVIPDGNIDAALARDSEVTSAVSTHAGLTSTHGATGAVMGTTNTQTAYSKTLYSSADTTYPYWHKNNDGSGSGLDADTLDGSHAASFATSSHTHGRIMDEGGTGNNLRVSSANEIEFFSAAGVVSPMYLNYSSTDKSSVKGPGGSVFWNAGNDGSDSGLDADLLEGYHAVTANAVSTIPVRDSSGDITTRLFKSTYAEQTTAAATTADIAFRNDTSDNYIRFMSAAAFKAWLQACQIGIVQTSAPASPVNGDIWTE